MTTYADSDEWTEEADTLLSSFDELVVLYDSKVRSAIRSVEGFTPDEDDLVQEVFIRLLIRLRRTGSLRVGAWLWRVARNLAIDDLRRRHTRTGARTALDRAQETSVESRHDDGLNECLSVIFREMPERQREALLTVAEHGGRRSGSCQAVAASLGVTTAAAEGLLARGRSRLASDLARSGFAFRPAAAIGLVRLALGRLSRHAAGLRRGHAIAMAVVGTAGVGVAVPLLMPAIWSEPAPRPVPHAAHVLSMSPDPSGGYRVDSRWPGLWPAGAGGRNQLGSDPGEGGPSTDPVAPATPVTPAAPVTLALGVVETSTGLESGLTGSVSVLSAGGVASAFGVTSAGSGTAGSSHAPLVYVDRVAAGGVAAASPGQLPAGRVQLSQPLLMAVATAAPLSPTPSL